MYTYYFYSVGIFIVAAALMFFAQKHREKKQIRQITETDIKDIPFISQNERLQGNILHIETRIVEEQKYWIYAVRNMKKIILRKEKVTTL